ncbi:hypothetical protein E2R51_08790 [Jeotgalibacillus sp. S-D1]|uniref:hypothetical protein n=1 Tax=Jeotgalibacillus sp. S-D1 TaxID=2552189 RepID=UPI0010599F26|nr:hypothetical protein [Jeotgalibacillus sp. S-D1]TDL32760.1 hypothetical protein E2R51_08790 [Jeotgalibacillus sp. S-D1]
MKKILVLMGILICLFGCSNGMEMGEEKNNFTVEPGFSILTKASPNQVHIIELKEMMEKRAAPQDLKDNEIMYTYSYHSFRIYYGEYGNLLEKYKEFDSFDLTTVDYFDIQWTNDNLVTVKVFRKKDDGSSYEAESIKLDASD